MTQIDGNKLIEAIRKQRDEALDAVALLQVQLEQAVAQIPPPKKGRKT